MCQTRVPRVSWDNRSKTLQMSWGAVGQRALPASEPVTWLPVTQPQQHCLRPLSLLLRLSVCLSVVAELLVDLPLNYFVAPISLTPGRLPLILDLEDKR